MVEKGIRGGICNAVHHYAKTNNKYMDNVDENKESSYINYCDVNNLYGRAISQRLPTFNFQWIEDILQYNEVSINNYDEKNEVGYILEVDVKYPKELYELHGDLPFSPEKKKLGKFEKHVTN